MNDKDIASRSTESLGRPQLSGGRLGTYTALGAATGIVPLPWLPDAVARRIRGALVHDLTARHGLSITPEARAALVEPEKEKGARRYFDQGVKFALTQVLMRLGPFGAVGPVRSALATFTLGHLLQRYLDGGRTERSVRIDVEEARSLREAMDAALLLALTTEGERGLGGPAFPPEDLRDGTTQFVDGIFISMASAPGWLVRRLDAAFDEVLPRHMRK